MNATGQPVFVGIDVGSYSTKGVLARADGTVVHDATERHDIDTPRPGWAEQDADQVWWHDVCAVSQRLTAVAAREGLPIEGVAISAIGPTVLPVDAHGRPLRASILYGIDARASREIEELNAELGEERILEIGGSPLTSQAVGPKIRWLQRHEPDVWERTERVLTAHSYIGMRLTGRAAVDVYSAAAQAPLFDLGRRAWSDDLVPRICSPALLPEVVPSTQVLGTVTRDAAEQTGLPEGTPVAPGTIDAAAEALAAGVHAPGDMMVMYGTTAFFIHITTEHLRSPALWGGVWLDGEHPVLTAGMSTAGAITEWLKRELTDLEDDAAFATLFDEAERSSPGAGGVLVLPYFSGERTPINAPHARGVVAGLSLNSTRGDLMRGVLEAIGFGVRHHLEAMAELGAEPQRLVAIGGGTRSSTLLQLVSDITGMPQDVPEGSWGASLGDALLAAVATGHLADVAAAASTIRSVRRIEPQGNGELYDRRYALYRKLFEQTEDIVAELGSDAEVTP